MFESVGSFLSEIIHNYAAYEYPVASAQLLLAMLGMGALLTPQDFLLEVKKPRGLLLGFGIQWLLVPLLAVVLGAVLPVPAGIAVGLIFVAAVPGGTLANVLTLIARGNIALSISLTAITTVAALFTTPLLLQLLISQYLPDDFSMPIGLIARDIFGILVIPLVLGMLIKAWTNTLLAAQFSKWCIRLSLMMILVIVAGSAGSGRLDIDAYGVIGVVALVIFVLSIQASTVLVGKVMGLEKRDGMALTIVATFRNISLAIAVKATVFPARPGVLDPIGDAVLFVGLLYAGISMIMMLALVSFQRKFSQAR